MAQASGPGFDSRWLPGFFLFQLALGCRWGDESVCAHPCKLRTFMDFFYFPIEIDNAGIADTAMRSCSCISDIGVSVGAVIVVVCLVAIYRTQCNEYATAV